MKFTTTSAALNRAALRTVQTLDRSSDSFSQILVKADNGRVSLSATNGRHHLVYDVEDAKVLKPGRCLIPGVRASALLAKLKGDLTVSLSRNRVAIDAGPAGKFSLTAGDPKLFPPSPATGDDSQPEMAIDGDELHRLLIEVRYAAMSKESGVGLYGVYLCAEDGVVEVCATDGVSFSKSTGQATGSLTGHTDPLHLDALQAVIPALRKEQVLLRSLSSYWYVSVGPMQLWMGRSSRRFPEYNKLLDSLTWGHEVSISQADLSAGLNRTLAMFDAQTPHKTIQLVAEEDSLRLKANSEFGASSVSMDGSLTGQATTVNLDASRLDKALHTLRKSDTITLSLGDNRTPVKLTAPAQSQHLALVALVVPGGA